MEQRLEFALNALKHETSMAELCRHFGISRKTGYYWMAWYQTAGVDGLKARSRAAHHHPNAISDDVCAAVLRAKAAHPSWGPKKLQPLAGESEHIAACWPVASTRGAILARAGLTVARRQRRHVPPRTQPFASVEQPNDTWCADFKGWFRTADGHRCEPLTISDAYSRMLLRCQAMRDGTSAELVQPLFEVTFREYGLPQRIRTDNGPPFVSVGAGGVSALSIWWIKLGILPERIDPGAPQQNGRHERLHRTLEEATARPPAATLTAQQRRFDAFRRQYNTERPHEALQQHTPLSCWQPSPRAYPRRLEEPAYADEANVRRVRLNGCMKWQGELIYIHKALVGEPVGVFETDSGWLVRYGPIDLGWIDVARRGLRRPVRRRPHPPRTAERA